MRFKLDENLPVELLDDLRAAGHEAHGLFGEGLVGAPDNVVLDLVRRENRVLLTLDKGIADVRAYPPEAHAGIVLFRPTTTARQLVGWRLAHEAHSVTRELTAPLDR